MAELYLFFSWRTYLKANERGAKLALPVDEGEVRDAIHPKQLDDLRILWILCIADDLGVLLSIQLLLLAEETHQQSAAQAPVEI